MTNNIIDHSKVLEGSIESSRNAYVLGGEPMIFHCHHYNTFLQMSIEETRSYLDIYPILRDSAQEVSYQQYTSLFQKFGIKDVSTRIDIVSEGYKKHGFGNLRWEVCSETSSKAIVDPEHYAEGWISKFGKRDSYDEGVAVFTSGYLAGAVEAVFDLTMGSLQGQQTQCTTQGADQCAFTVYASSSGRNLHPSPKEGEFQLIQQLYQPQETGIRYDAIKEALTSMPIVGDEQGLIQAFGVLLTRHYANYYTLISYRLLHAMSAKYGDMGVNIVKDLLIEAGHVCAFNTFGGIMESAEWNALIKPMITNREDWVHGIVACVNALGWGQWKIQELIPYEKLVIEIDSGYEANSYLQSFKKSTYPISFLATGGSAGIMNLIYNGDITETPTLDDDYYASIFRSSNRFVAKQTQCRAMGDPTDQFVVTKAKG